MGSHLERTDGGLARRCAERQPRGHSPAGAELRANRNRLEHPGSERVPDCERRSRQHAHRAAAVFIGASGAVVTSTLTLPGTAGQSSSPAGCPALYELRKMAVQSKPRATNTTQLKAALQVAQQRADKAKAELRAAKDEAKSAKKELKRAKKALRQAKEAAPAETTTRATVKRAAAKKKVAKRSAPKPAPAPVRAAPAKRAPPAKPSTRVAASPEKRRVVRVRKPKPAPAPAEAIEPVPTEVPTPAEPEPAV